jgi:hypothetical protein
MVQAQNKAAKKQGKTMVQTKVDGMLGVTSKAPKVFNWQELLKVVVVHIAASDQVSSTLPLLK